MYNKQINAHSLFRYSWAVTPYTAVNCFYQYKDTGCTGSRALLHYDLILSNYTCDDSPSK